jgi:hypothetical protein
MKLPLPMCLIAAIVAVTADPPFSQVGNLIVNIQAAPPTLVVLDQLKEAQRFKIENAAGILSPQTWSQRDGLDYDQEQANFVAYRHQLTTNPS